MPTYDRSKVSPIIGDFTALPTAYTVALTQPVQPFAKNLFLAF